jgi:hypothetical protein
MAKAKKGINLIKLFLSSVETGYFYVGERSINEKACNKSKMLKFNNEF